MVTIKYPKCRQAVKKMLVEKTLPENVSNPKYAYTLEDLVSPSGFHYASGVIQVSERMRFEARQMLREQAG